MRREIAVEPLPGIDADAAVLADSGILVYYRAFYDRAFRDADVRPARQPVRGLLRRGFVVVRAHADDPVETGSRFDHRANADDRARDRGVRYDAALGGQRQVYAAIIELGRGKVALVGVDGPILLVEIEFWIDRREVQVGFVEGLYGADVLPVAVEDIGVDGLRGKNRRN